MTKSQNNMEKAKDWKGWLALSPLFVFLAVYLISSLLVGDFYKIPISAAFLVASIYAVLITGGHKFEDRIQIFSRGAAQPNILLMIWIFILAGTFASTSEALGSITSVVNMTKMILPGKLIYAGLFLAACVISISIGTSVGTIAALMPMASQFGNDTAFIAAIIVGGAFFGDNLSFISDTTIAATRTQGVSMKDKFKVNYKIVGPAAAIVLVVYVVLGWTESFSAPAGPVEWIKLIPYTLVLVMAFSGVNVIPTLTVGLLANAVIGVVTGDMYWSDWMSSIGSGISSMSELIIITLLAGGLMELIRHGGGIDLLIRLMTRKINGKRGAEFSIAGLVCLANLCTANNTIAIITAGDIAKGITQRFGLDPRKVASILDTFSCLVQGFIPYGAQLLMAAGLAKISSVEIIGHLYYPFTMGLFAILSIVFRYPKATR